MPRGINDRFTIIRAISTAVTVKRAEQKRMLLFTPKNSMCSKCENDEFSPQTANANQLHPRLRFSLWKLSLNVGTFIASNILFVVIFFVYFVTGDICAQYNHFLGNEVETGIVWTIQSLRIIADPILSFVTDKAVSMPVNPVVIPPPIFPHLTVSYKQNDT
jgi:hypothetical protein